MESSNFYTLGWLECCFSIFNQLTNDQATQYLSLLRITGYKGDEKILESISSHNKIIRY